MSEAWYPAAARNDGACAGYQRGRTSVQCVKAHYTVGRDSTGIGLQGYFQFLIARDGTVQQFAPVDALCWDSGEWNGMGPGIEVEYLPDADGDQIFTPAAQASCGALVAWLASEWGVPLTYYDGPRLRREDGFAGFISHRSLVQSEEHFDYWPQADWDAMTAPVHTESVPTPPAPVPQEDDDMKLVHYSVRDDKDPTKEVGTGRDIYGVLADGEDPVLDPAGKAIPFDAYATIKASDWTKAKP